MGQKLYVGNLPFTATENELRDLFSQHGAVESAQIVTDRDTGQPRGFAFVEMDTADAAIGTSTLSSGRSTTSRSAGGTSRSTSPSRRPVAAVVADTAAVVVALAAGKRQTP